ncbi:MAG: cysteine synthase family protein [Patescibacteria group bacterium]
MKYQNLIQSIGNTPMIEFNNLSNNKQVKILAKLEGQNPGGSVKDRVALFMIKQAEKRKQLKPGKIILEATSGNMGISLAMIGAYKKYQVHIVMSAGMSAERKSMLKALGATLILTHPKFGTCGAIDKAKELEKKYPQKYWFVNQFNNPDNVRAHYHDTAKEILNEVNKIDYLIAGSGTSGTLMGLANRFKKYSPHTKIIGVIPTPGYKIQGLQNPKRDFSGAIFNNNLIDKEYLVSPPQAYNMARWIATHEGLLVGMSSGASLFVSKQISLKLTNKTIVVILPDRGEKYLSTDLFKSELLK